MDKQDIKIQLCQKKRSPGTNRSMEKKYGDVFCVVVGDKVAYLKRPSRQALSAAAVVGKNDPMKYNEILLNNCWLDGDEEIKTDDSLFLGVSAKLGELVEVKEAELKSYKPDGYRRQARLVAACGQPDPGLPAYRPGNARRRRMGFAGYFGRMGKIRFY